MGDKVSVGGYGSGGYISLSLATLNNFEEELLLPKFYDYSQDGEIIIGLPTPYINQNVMGNLEATDYGYLYTSLEGDSVNTNIPYCIPNHVGYSSEVDMVFNAGGALLDISWFEEGEIPIASMQNINDHIDPYTEGFINTPFLYNPIFIAHGSQLVQEVATAYGNNDVFDSLSTSIDHTWYSNGDAGANATIAGHYDMPGLFGMITPAPASSPTACGFETVQNTPWDWWDSLTILVTVDPIDIAVLNCLSLLNNLDMSEEKGLAFANILSEFFTPRVFAALNVDGTLGSSDFDTDDLELLDLSIYPNPAKNEIRNSTDTEISTYELFDLTGKLILNKMNINSQSTTIYRNGLNSGLYLTMITDTNCNSIIRKIIFE